MSGGSISVSAPAAERHHAAARTKGPDRPTSGPAPQPTSRARRSFPSRTLHPKAGGTRGIREATPPKNGRQRPNGIRAWTSPTPFHPKRTENRRLRQRPQTEEKEGRRGRRGRRKGRRKGGRKPESREAGSRKAGKPGSGEAGKRGSREAGGGIKKRRRTVGCTPACGSQQSLAYRNYLLR